MTLLAIDKLTVRYGRLTALRGVSLSMVPGEILFVTGPNGAGKSTLLKAVAGTVPHVEGTIQLAGRTIDKSAPEAIARLGLSMVPEGRHVFTSLTVEENLRVGTGMRPDKADAAREIESVFTDFPRLADRRQTAAGMLSGGEQQMLVIARALMTAPKLIALDEPSLGLAPKIIDQVYQQLLELRARRNLTLLIVEQSSTRAVMTGGRMVVLRGGEIVLEGDAGKLGADQALHQAYFGFEAH